MTGTSQGLFIDKYTVVYMYTQNKQKGIKSKQFEQAQEFKMNHSFPDSISR